jgi:hypothetical protein
MEVEVPLSTGAFEAMWREHGLRPVLQPGMLAASLSHLVARGALRCGTVIRVLEYFAGFYHNQR